MYILYDQNENIISKETICFNESYGIETYIIPEMLSGNYRIVITTNNQEYYGYLDF